MKTAEITHHPSGPVDGSGRERLPQWRVYILRSGQKVDMTNADSPHAVFPHDDTPEARRAAHGLAMDYATRAMVSA